MTAVGQDINKIINPSVTQYQIAVPLFRIDLIEVVKESYVYNKRNNMFIIIIIVIFECVAAVLVSSLWSGDREGIEE